MPVGSYMSAPTFDDAGINHVNAILAVAPTARPWRMSSEDYLDGLDRSDGVRLRLDRLSATPWDPRLLRTMTQRGVAVDEEALLDGLLGDMML